MDNRMSLILKLDEIRKQQKQIIESTIMINKIHNKYGLSNKSRLEILERLNDESDYLSNQLLEIKESI